VERDEAWQREQVDYAMAAVPWLARSLAVRAARCIPLGLLLGAVAGASAGGLAYAGGDPWVPVGFVLLSLGGFLGLLAALAPRRYYAWMLRQQFVTDATFRRGDNAMQRDGMKTSGPTGKAPPYWRK
jgi:hypothetical protein